MNEGKDDDQNSYGGRHRQRQGHAKEGTCRGRDVAKHGSSWHTEEGVVVSNGGVWRHEYKRQ
ncbi:ribosome small subunit-dependent GTPase A [Sesbania bispinosa]|nr:ribosome small subunit-dependent GTPase A [Sesbania bispinosa]